MTEASHKPALLRRRAALVSIFASLAIFSIKCVAAFWTNSAIIRADALESVVNVVAAFLAFGAVSLSERPADSDHPYGHGKAEYFSALVEGALVGLAGVLIGIDAILRLINEPVVTELGHGTLLMAFAGVLNGALGFYLLRRGKALRSAAIEADGHHVLSDFWTSVVSIIGLFGVIFSGWLWIDSTLALMLAVWLIWTSVSILKDAVSPLMDQTDPKLSEKIVRALEIERDPGIIALHEMRVMRSGRLAHVDVHIVVPEFESVRDSHDRVESFCARVLKRAEVEGEFHPHVDPCEAAYCESCSYESCPIRRSEFKTAQSFTVETVTRPGLV